MSIESIKAGWNQMSTGKKAAVIGGTAAATALVIGGVAVGKGTNILVKNNQAIDTFVQADKFKGLDQEVQGKITTGLKEKAESFAVSSKVQEKVKKGEEVTFFDKLLTGLNPKNFFKGTKINVEKEAQAIQDKLPKVRTLEDVDKDLQAAQKKLENEADETKKADIQKEIDALNEEKTKLTPAQTDAAAEVENKEAAAEPEGTPVAEEAPEVEAAAEAAAEAEAPEAETK